MMNGWVVVVLCFPRYLLVAGITVLALAFCTDKISGYTTAKQMEGILPTVLHDQIPVGVLGFLLAGLLAALMSNFAATLNAAPAYIVNDVYKRFINPASTPRNDVFLSRVVSVLVLVVGIICGLLTERIAGIMDWIIGAFLGAYVTANVLKWIWWRFNGYGYFWGMMAGMATCMAGPPLITSLVGHSVNPLYTFPLIFALSAIGCLLGTYLGTQEDDSVLKSFYRTVRPWGFWGPILKKVQQDDPTFLPNPNFVRDMVNVAVGIVWQLCLVSLPIFLVLRDWTWVMSMLAVLAVACVFLKFSWYDKLHELDDVPGTAPGSAREALAAESV